MSSMLEQAMIDAKALKESAIKNAEAIIVEKYSDQIRSAVSSLLEQDELDLDLGLDEDPLAGEGDLEGAPAVAGDATADPSLNQIPTALEEDLPGGAVGNDSQPMVFDLADLRQAIDNGESPPASELEAEKEPHEELAQDLAPAVEDSPEADSPLAEANEAEDLIEIDDSLVDDILERLTVDIDPQPRGWAGTPRSQMEQFADMELARQADDKVKEENEALRSRVKELEESLSTTTDQKEILIEENDKFKEAILILKEKVDIVNVSNAKLLYINKALENSSLNERQKRKIVEAISKAGTTKEAKVIYETLQSTVGSTEKRSVPKSLSEAVSRSNSSLLINSQRNRENTNSTDPFSERLQRLAGIKK